MPEHRSCANCAIESICRVSTDAKDLLVSGEWGLEGGAKDAYWQVLRTHLSETLAARCSFFRGAKKGTCEAEKEAEPREQKEHWCNACFYWQTAMGCHTMGLRCQDFTAYKNPTVVQVKAEHVGGAGRDCSVCSNTFCKNAGTQCSAFKP